MVAALFAGALNLCSKPDHRGLCAEAATPNETLSLTVEHRPDIAILTPKISDFGSLGLHRFKGSVPAIEILIVSEYFSETFVHEVLKSGSRGFVSDSDPETVFMRAVESLINHKPFLTPKAVQVILNSMPDMSGSSLASFRSNPLTAREREVAQLLAGGRRVKGIANELSLSHRTVDTHKTSIIQLGLHSSVRKACSVRSKESAHFGVKSVVHVARELLKVHI